MPWKIIKSFIQSGLNEASPVLSLYIRHQNKVFKQTEKLDARLYNVITHTD